VVASGVVAGLDLEPDRAVVRFAGQLTLRTSADVRRVLAKLLASHGEVLVDLSSFRLAWQPAARVFATALSRAGGWPAGRLVLFGADPVMAAELRASGATRTVPLVSDLAVARAQARVRPETVARRLRLQPSLAAPRTARDFTSAACLDWQVDDEVATTARLVVNELVTNVVEHTGTECDLTVRLTRRGLFVQVRDHLPGAAPRPRPRPVGARGRGLHVVACLAAQWDVTSHVDGKTVWALVPLAAPSPRWPGAASAHAHGRSHRETTTATAPPADGPS
jgi:anti-sigma regulatory factor (Ser/Thr protein kinase)